ncbi:soluble lytic murein transglycosylase-like protein [Hoeflea sp. IMCC20628]|uniref:lytic transglycosylase domain-containing protein n=1 Tax=Hoeflea sp. IMCC20628 TaxID=1620421 RepID=UPI00063ADFE7|nr:lytic transglycosylase domain-containing protein [Hoeflea sp. IMCC20628]AKH99866.1 soluble lytic murein transglycosylase-like protein [Hoeflea sp. IMCC20628]
MSKITLVTLFTLSAVVATLTTAAPLPTNAIPLPVPKPGVVSSETTAAILKSNMTASASLELKAGLEALGDKDAARARTIRDSMTRNTLDHHILTWAIAVSGLEGVPSGEIALAATELKGWPGLTSLRQLSERALFYEKPVAAKVLAAFGNTLPETAKGAIALIRALKSSGDTQRAGTLASTVWRTLIMDNQDAKVFLSEFDGLLDKGDHLRRMEMLLYRDHVNDAKPLSQKAEAQSLYRAWAAVITNPAKAAGAIAAVDKSWHDKPSYLYLRIKHLRELERDKEAAALLAKMPRDRATLVDPDEWWIEARVVSRGLYEKGDAKTAYRLAAAHLAQSPEEFAEAEFHAGWYALRGLKDAKTAAKHFAAILSVANGQISKARAHYWLGRAAEAGGGGKSSDFYALAAQFPSTFYGQLANAKLNRKSLNIAYPSPSDQDRVRFASREAVRAIRKLEDAGYDWRADTLYRGLAAELDSPGELAILAALAEKRGDHRVSLQVGKIAWNRGLDVAALAYPLGAVPASANIAGAGKALAYSIARQESAFNTAAVSPANARGLLQILPGTAKGVAARHGLPFSQNRLTTDAGYNATLGAHFLGEQISKFGGSYILTFIAYNAGPRRVSQWIERLGDPRGRSLDEVIDWIEMIPFTETRHYVQRVMENYQVYKARLGQTASIEDDLRFGRR